MYTLSAGIFKQNPSWGKQLGKLVKGVERGGGGQKVGDKKESTKRYETQVETQMKDCNENREKTCFWPKLNNITFSVTEQSKPR